MTMSHPLSGFVCKGVTTCPAIGTFATHHAAALAQIDRLTAEREQLIEACSLLVERNFDLQAEVDELWGQAGRWAS